MRILGILLALSLSVGAGAAEKTFTTKQYPEQFGTGLVRHPEKFKEFKKSTKRVFAGKDAVIPGKFDLSAKVSPPENQGSHGTCWDFAIIKALRSEYMLDGRDPGQLSFNYLICNNHTPYSCDSGGDFDAMQQVIGGKGPWSSKNDPYPNCSGRCVSGQPTIASGVSVVQVGDRQPSFKELASAMTAGKGHVLVVDVAVCGQWGNYSGGIFNQNQCGAGNINHMINMVGYDCETSVDAKGNCVFNQNGQPVNGDGYLKPMNNWGSWGENGYMRSRWGIDALAYTAAYFEIEHAPEPPAPPEPPVPGPTPNPNNATLPWVIVAALVTAIVMIFIVIGVKKS